MGELQGKIWPEKPSAMGSTIEPRAAFAKRTIDWWKRSLLPCVAKLGAASEGAEGADADAATDPPRAVLVVSHGAFIDVLMRELVGARHAEAADGVRVGGIIDHVEHGGV
jgi:broad specificity phosphatase PhoE